MVYKLIKITTLQQQYSLKSNLQESQSKTVYDSAAQVLAQTQVEVRAALDLCMDGRARARELGHCFERFWFFSVSNRHKHRKCSLMILSR